MNKDAILATAIGFAVGLIVTSIVLFGSSLTKNIKFPSIHISFASLFQPKKPTPTPAENTSGQRNDLFVTIDSPIPESLETTDKILVSGTTTPKTVVVISSDTEDAVTEATDDGKYAGKVSLIEGINTLVVTSMGSDKKQVSKTVIVYFTPETL